jgi:catechol 2,3-dioxygenase-like lactoylglutathione lyase family enzyme
VANVGVRWMFHATAMVRDYDGTLAPLQRLFGFRVLHDNVVEDERIGRRGGMTWVGDGSLEIGEPAGEGSPVAAFVDRFGGGMHSVGLQIDDAEAAKAHFAALGVRVASEPYPGLLFTHPANTAGVLLEWNALPQEDDPRWGAPVPDGPAPVVAVERLAFVTAAVRDARADGRRLAEVLGTTVTFDSHTAARDGFETGVSLVDCTLALLPLDAAGVDRPRAHGLGLQVADLGAAERELATRGVRVARRSEHAWLLDPDALPVPVFLCDRLLPCDPRVS